MPEICNQPSPSKETACDLVKGHEGRHHGFSRSNLIANLVYEYEWEEGTPELTPCAYFDRFGNVHTNKP